MKTDSVQQDCTTSESIGAIPGSPGLQAQVAAWIGHLSLERQYSTHTLESYRRDLAQFLAFLTRHCGALPTVESVFGITPADLRSYLADRRQGGAQNRTLARSLASLRSFARHLERQGYGTATVYNAVRSPKLKRSLPKPVSASAAVQLAGPDLRAGENRPDWVLDRDAAVIGLLYGCG
ncbi:MAG: site-specific integrase, partial [Hyphomicrobiales bacterium]|nr:site-specific integrase [Hyphomicrobiales bacterium]